MTGRQLLGRVLLAVLVVGLLAGAGYAIYRLGYSAGLAQAAPMGEMRGFMFQDGPRGSLFEDGPRQFTFEREPRFGFPDRFHPRMQEPLRPGVRIYTRSAGLLWPWAGSPWLGFGVALLGAAAVIGLVVVLFRWAFRPSPSTSGEARQPEG